MKKRDDLVKGENSENVDKIIEEIKSQKAGGHSENDNKKASAKKRSLIIIPILLFLFIASTAYSIFRVKAMNEPLKVSDEEKTTALKDYIYLVNTKILAFRIMNSRLPNTGEEASIEDTFIKYTLIDDTTYSITCKYENISYTYVSNEDAEALLSPQMLKQLSK